MDELTIRDIRARAVMVPLRRPLVSARGAIPTAPLVLLDLETEQGITGRSYLFAFSPGMLKPIVGCVEALRDILKGDALAPFETEQKVRKRFTELARAVSMSASAVTERVRRLEEAGVIKGYSAVVDEERLGLPSTARSDGWKDGVVMLRFDEAVFVSRDEAGL